MASNAVLNVRLPEDLKKHGNQVLSRNGISVSQIIRDLYSYMEAEQDIPSFAKPSHKADKFENRRRLLKEIDLGLDIPTDLDLKKIKDERIMEKYGERL